MPCSANGLCPISAQSDIMGEASRHLADRFKDALHVDLPFPTLRTMDRKAGRWLRRRRRGTPAPVESYSSSSVIRCTRRLFSPRQKAHRQEQAHNKAPPLKVPPGLDFSKHLSSAHKKHLECPRRGRRWLRRSRSGMWQKTQRRGRLHCACPFTSISSRMCLSACHSGRPCAQETFLHQHLLLMMTPNEPC